jgi:hypothetical protein
MSWDIARVTTSAYPVLGLGWVVYRRSDRSVESCHETREGACLREAELCYGGSSVTQPWVGEPSTEYRPICVYSSSPGHPRCDAPASAHVMVADDRYGVVALTSCGTHAGLARTSGRFIMEHQYEGVCGFPGTLWDEITNRCVLDDSGQSREVRKDALACRPI